VIDPLDAMTGPRQTVGDGQVRAGIAIDDVRPGAAHGRRG
jgi:hypothetical protein